MTRVVVVGAGLAMHRALIDLARAVDRAQVVFVTHAEQLRRAHDALELCAHPPLDLMALAVQRAEPAPQFGSARPYLKRKKGRS